MSAKPTYRIRDWSEHFENHDSRKLRNLRFVCVPNRQDGKGYRRVAAHPRAPELFAAWVLILQVGSKMRERGFLVDEDGAIDAIDLAAMTGFPAAIFELAFEVLTDTKIGWLEAVFPPENTVESPDITPNSPGNASNNGAISRHLPENTTFFALEGKGREGKYCGRASGFAAARKHRGNGISLCWGQGVAADNGEGVGIPRILPPCRRGL